jgi:nucleoside-diphosphate-sugar epimerase
MILVTGGTGAMGSMLVRELAKRNHRVRIVCLPHDPFVSRVKDCAADIRYADVSKKQDCIGMCDGVSAVYHLAAIIISKDESAFAKINVEGTQNIVEQAVKSNVSQFVYISSASVVYPHPTPYSLSKRSAEDIVVKSGLPFSIIRPTLVYGEKGGQEFDMYLNYLRKFPVVPFIGNGVSLKRPVYVEDITAGLLALYGNQTSLGRIYNFSGGEALSILDFSRLCLRCMGMENKPIVHLPVWLCTIIARLMGLVMKDPPLKWQVIAGITQDANLDPSEAMADLGYAPKKVSEWLPKVFPRRTLAP